MGTLKPVIGGWDIKVKSSNDGSDAAYHRARRAGTLVIRVPKMTPEEIKLARDMYESGGFFLREIGEIIGKNPSAIWRRAHNEGWKRDPAHTARFSAKQSQARLSR